jgi:hypothetical protein
MVAPRSPLLVWPAVGGPAGSSSRSRPLAAASDAAAPPAAVGVQPFAGGLRRKAAAAAARLAARLSLARCVVAAFVRQHRLRARACGFVAGCVFALAAAAPLPAHAMTWGSPAPAAVTPGLPIQEKIARQHEAWVVRARDF